jgi:glycosyl transferase family 4
MASASGDVREATTPLPRIAVISDVTPERTGAGNLLLYRLLKDYPGDRLRIIYDPAHASRAADVRLPEVPYYPIAYRFPRAIRNRFNPFWPIAGAIQMRVRVGEVLRTLGDFHPDAVVSVANGFLWFTANAVARELGIPLHLFLHEDWPQLVTLGRHGLINELVKSAARTLIKPIFLRRGARFSVSPGMAEELLERYGLSTEVLYPSRGEDSPAPIVRVGQLGSAPPTVVHAGFIHLGGNAALLREVASILLPLGGHLDLYTTHTEADLARLGLVGPVVRRIGYFPANELAERVASTAHALFLTASFDENDRVHESTLFPSKLADYTGIGLPILVWGPSYSSAARWVAQNPRAALLFTSRDPQPVRDAITKVTSSTEYAHSLAEGAVETGKQFFELSMAREQLRQALLKGRG